MVISVNSTGFSYQYSLVKLIRCILQMKAALFYAVLFEGIRCFSQMLISNCIVETGTVPGSSGRHNGLVPQRREMDGFKSNPPEL